MAPVAQLGCFILHQELTFLCMVRIVAVRATNAVLQVGGAPKIAVLFTLVTIQAARADICRRGILKGKDFRLVAPALYVLFAWSVAGLAAMPFRSLFCVQRGRKVRRSLVILVEIFRRHIF